MFTKRGETQTKKIYLKPRKRIIKNFLVGQEATVKIVFERSHLLPGVRWFYGDNRTGYMPHAEEPHKLDIKGDLRFKVHSLRSGNIMSVTLTINRVEDFFPIAITTLFNYGTSLFQYLLETVISMETHYRDDILDSVVWHQVPHETITMNDSDISIKCVAGIDALPSRSGNFGELLIYKSTLERKNKGTISVLKAAALHKISIDRNGSSESTSGKFYRATEVNQTFVRSFNNSNRILYTLMNTFKVSNASEEDTGVYTCTTEFSKHRVYSSSWVTDGRSYKPDLIFRTCEENTMQIVYLNSSREDHYNYFRASQQRGYDDFHGRYQDYKRQKKRNPLYVATLTRGRPTCIKCSAFDSLMSNVNLVKLSPNNSRTLILDHHKNVPDGAMSEVTATFLNPSDQDAGRYMCNSTNISGFDQLEFEIKIVN